MAIGLVMLCNATGAQPTDSASAAASSPPRTASGPVQRPAPRPLSPPGSDPITQTGLGKPVIPQIRIPLGKKPPLAASGAASSAKPAPAER